MTKEELQTVLNLGQFAQVGCVVQDLSRSIRNYEEVIGIGPFSTFEFRPEKSFIKDRKSDLCLKIGIAQLNADVTIELIEVVKGDPYHKDFLNKFGGGVQHLGFMTNEYDQVLKRAEKLGIEVSMWAETDVPGMGHVRGAYLDTTDLIGTMVEIIEVKPF